MKLSIKDYAEKRGISPQAVYQAVAKGTLKSIVDNGKKYIVADTTEVANLPAQVEGICTKKLEKTLKKLQKAEKSNLKLKHKLELAVTQLKSSIKLAESQERELEVLQRGFKTLSTVVEKKLIETVAVAEEAEPEAEEAELEEAKPTKKKKKKKK